ncbi:MAG: DUF523 domain-containing protein [Dethiobacteria bacterium]
MYLVSTCLLGIKSRYDGGDNLCRFLTDNRHRMILIPVCPEQLGGLPTPREPAEIRGGDGNDVLREKATVTTRDGGDVTANFIRGAEEVLKLALFLKVKGVILKEGSPSCGYGRIHDGSFTGGWREGHGVTASLLEKNHFKIYTEDNLPRV